MDSLRQNVAEISAADAYQLVVEAWGDGVPQSTCSRIRNEIREIEELGGGELVIKPVKDSPLLLEVRLVGWDPNQMLGQDLRVLARASGR